jgi:hypothetical protein
MTNWIREPKCKQCDTYLDSITLKQELIRVAEENENRRLEFIRLQCELSDVKAILEQSRGGNKKIT